MTSATYCPEHAVLAVYIDQQAVNLQSLVVAMYVIPKIAMYLEPPVVPMFIKPAVERISEAISRTFSSEKES